MSASDIVYIVEQRDGSYELQMGYIERGDSRWHIGRAPTLREAITWAQGQHTEYGLWVDFLPPPEPPTPAEIYAVWDEVLRQDEWHEQFYRHYWHHLLHIWGVE